MQSRRAAPNPQPLNGPKKQETVKPILFFIVLLPLFCTDAFSQLYPTFGPEKKVTVTGLTFDAMEPFISPDDNIIYFNSLNSGGNTNLYYATKVNDTTFNYVGLVGGTFDPAPNHLDAVASIDSSNRFFWTSLRDYPDQIANLRCGTYSDGNVSSISPVFGDFNIDDFNFPFGWLIMDAAINYQGDLLYYCNAKFDFSNTSSAGIPCEAKLGVAQKINDNTFNKLPDSDAIFANINDQENYLVYAPQITPDGLELYYTRLLKNTVNTEICVSVRTSVTEPFSPPSVIHSNQGFLPEAASPSVDQQKIYYHQKDQSGIFQLYLRYRTQTAGLEMQESFRVKIYPNPADDFVTILPDDETSHFTATVYNMMGQEMFSADNTTSIDLSKFATGLYCVVVRQNDNIWKGKIVKQ